MGTNNKKILVADDDVLVRKLLEEFLGFYGYNVDCVSNGEDAIRLIETGYYDILITDYIMPKINGLELIKRVRSLNLSLLIIGMSGTGDEKEFLTAGANFFMNKPIPLKKLKDILEREF